MNKPTDLQLAEVRKRIVSEIERKKASARQRREAAQRETEAAEREEAEFAELAKRLKRVEEANKVLQEELAALEATKGEPSRVVLHPRQTPHPPPQDDNPRSIKEAVLGIVLNTPKTEGWAASEVANLLIARGMGQHVTPRTFYSMTYMALKRAAEAGRLKVKQGERGKLFSPTRSTQ